MQNSEVTSVGGEDHESKGGFTEEDTCSLHLQSGCPFPMSTTVPYTPALRFRSRLIATGEVTSVGGEEHESRGGFIEEDAPELDLEEWSRISQAKIEGKIFQREMTFRAKPGTVHRCKPGCLSRAKFSFLWDTCPKVLLFSHRVY